MSRSIVLRSVLWLLRILLASFWIMMGVSKFLALAEWASTLSHYPMLPTVLQPLLGLYLPGLEILLGLILLTPWQPTAHRLALTVLLILSLVLMWAYWGYGLSDCGCGYLRLSPPWALVRNALLMVLHGYVGWAYLRMQRRGGGSSAA